MKLFLQLEGKNDLTYLFCEFTFPQYYALRELWYRDGRSKFLPNSFNFF